MEIDMAVYGYARVSTDGQSLAAQLAELKAAKCEKIFQEKISGARSDRKQLLRLMGLLAKGDVLVSSPGSIDRRGPHEISSTC
jgi:DNA invertase Pin-like site-specific DNA recombinase